MHRIGRRTFLGAGTAGALGAAAKPAARRPNILFIMGDDLGYAGVGCYGQRKIRTPNIGQLAREGMRFMPMTAFHMDHTSVRSGKCGVGDAGTGVPGKHGRVPVRQRKAIPARRKRQRTANHLLARRHRGGPQIQRYVKIARVEPRRQIDPVPGWK